MKKLVIAFLVLSTLTISLVACSGSNDNTGSSSNNNEVHMSESTFTRPSVTIKKGSSLNIIDDAAITHILQNGTWDNGTARPRQEKGAPAINVTFNGSDSHSVGPFNTAGTFQIYCTVHPDMNLTVTVK